MSNTVNAKEIEALFAKPSNRSWYNFEVGKVVNNNVTSNKAKLDNIITNTETGHVLMRFFVKGHGIDIMFKPEDLTMFSSIIDEKDPFTPSSIEEGLRLIADAADIQGI